jgi:tetratricopeptide (TPR) repeat protein
MVGTQERESILCHLGDILGSPGFARSRRLSEFLTWVVNAKLSGDETSITERNIAIQVYGRPNDFDPKIDGTVRAEAMRLRHKLREYYEPAAAGSPRIEIPKGSYAPVFFGFEATPQVTATPAKYFSRGWLRMAAAAFIVTAVVGGALWSHSSRMLSSAKVATLLAKANHLRVMGDDFSALALVDEAAAMDSGNPDVHLTRAALLRNLGHLTQARAEAVEAQELADRQGRENAAIAEQLRALDLDWAGAREVARSLMRGEPTSLDFSIEMARIEMGHDPEKVEETVRAARKLPGGSQNPELDRLEALALGSKAMALNDPKGNQLPLAIVVRGEQKAAALGASWSLSRLKVLEAGLRLNRGDRQGGAFALHRARDLCFSTHDDICLAQTYRIEGNMLVDEGHYQQALMRYHEGLPLARQWQNWLETDHLMAGIDAVMEGLDPLLSSADVGLHGFQILPRSRAKYR